MITLKRFFGFALVMLLTTGAGAQGLLPKLGEQRAGTAAVTFLKIGVGARAVSMAGAYVAMANDGSAVFWNPAGLVQIGRNELMVSHLDWLADINYEFLSYTHQLNNNIALGAFVGYLHLADMPVTTEYHPYGNGEFFSYSDLVTGLTASIRMTDRFSFGLSVKYVREDMAGLTMDTAMMDLGTYYWTGFKSLRLAAAMRNFGNDLRPDGTYTRQEQTGTRESEYQAFSPPTVFSLGAAMDVYKFKKHALTTSVQMNHPMDDQESFVMGFEYQYRSLIYLRSGYRANTDENRWSFGTGLSLLLYGKQVKFDYSYADYQHLNMTQQLTFGFEF